MRIFEHNLLVLSNGELVTVEWVQHEILESPIKVYNFEVEDFYTYFVGECGVLVHNRCETWNEFQAENAGKHNFETPKIPTALKKGIAKQTIEDSQHIYNIKILA